MSNKKHRRKSKKPTWMHQRQRRKSVPMVRNTPSEYPAMPWLVSIFFAGLGAIFYWSGLRVLIAGAAALWYAAVLSWMLQCGGKRIHE